MDGAKKKWGFKNFSDRYLLGIESEYPSPLTKTSRCFYQFYHRYLEMRFRQLCYNTIVHIIKIYRINISRSSMFNKWAGLKFIYNISLLQKLSGKCFCILCWILFQRCKVCIANLIFSVRLPSKNVLCLISFTLFLKISISQKSFRKQSSWILLGDAKSVFPVTLSSKNGWGLI